MTLNLRCQCGTVTGSAAGITPDSGNRLVCCCEDCQRFAAYLGRSSDVLDPFGGTDIYQTSQSQIHIDTGTEHLQCVRLSSKGLIRWYTGCCKSPIGNTVSAGVPFIGVVRTFMESGEAADQALGPVRAYVQTRHAIRRPDYPHSAQGFPLGNTLRGARKLIVWKLRGMHKPSAFFDENGKTVAKAMILG